MKKMEETKLQNTYLQKISETFDRLTASASFLREYESTKSVYAFEASVLQVRKALECMAFASIAPNKTAYESLRLEADVPSDYRKDFNARKIIQLLNVINKDFYPLPLLPAVKKESGEWHYDLKTNGYLSKKKFESFYDRLGKFLHADNPWGNDKGVQNLTSEIPSVLNQIQELLVLHFTVVRTPEFLGGWVVEAGPNVTAPRVICGEASTDFVVQ